ncbi:NAD(P)H-binding protein [Archangium violaceum]|uniref:NmrA family NAD(P)-binding protein n=1 Tax=Archangium violaceum TaxID=83451 RepID=UPI00193C828F|nr:NAD(P)H-binding protein [Archangium violaceum]QRK12906.1 NAD(P)H-binding protein [Archangium violaceum]
MSHQNILVLGASGTIGRRVAARLHARGHSVRAASRSGDVRFDWADPDSWKGAVGNASRMYLMAPDGVSVEPSFVELAVSSGVRRIVLLSSKSIEVMKDERLMAAERTVRASGADWTIVRPDWFNQNFDEGFFREEILAGEVRLPVGDLRQAFNDADDIAAVIAVALTEDGHVGNTYELSGPRALSFEEAVDIIGRASGRRLRFVGTADAYIAALVERGLPEKDAKAAVDAFAALREQGDVEPNDIVRRVTGREPKPFETYAAEAAARGAWKN